MAVQGPEHQPPPCLASIEFVVIINLSSQVPQPGTHSLECGSVPGSSSSLLDSPGYGSYTSGFRALTIAPYWTLKPYVPKLRGNHLPQLPLVTNSHRGQLLLAVSQGPYTGLGAHPLPPKSPVMQSRKLSLRCQRVSLRSRRLKCL